MRAPPRGRVPRALKKSDFHYELPAELIAQAPLAERSASRLLVVPPGEAALRDQLLRLAAEFDNFRKREARERTEAWARAKADLIEKLLPALDDLRRVAHPEAADAPPDSPVRALLEGVELVERKLWQILEREGLQVVPAEGQRFDPAVHGHWSRQVGDEPLETLFVRG